MSDQRTRLRPVPRVHPAWLATAAGDVEHAGAETGGSLCGLPSTAGEPHRYLFEGVRRSETCPRCQALSDAVRAADLLLGVIGAVQRSELTIEHDTGPELTAVVQQLLAAYPSGSTSQPNFDVLYR